MRSEGAYIVVRVRINSLTSRYYVPVVQSTDVGVHAGYKVDDKNAAVT